MSPDVARFLVAAAVIVALSMALVHAFALRIRNASVVDVAWAFLFAPLALLGIGLLGGHRPRVLLIAGLFLAWSLRLALHLARRVARAHPLEDGRYQALRRSWGAAFDRRLFWFFQAQGLSVLLLSAPLALAGANREPALHALEWAAVLLFAVALAGEAAADRQLAAWQRAAGTRGRTCRRGLWRWSRHPNYFFEWLVWVAFALFAAASPFGLLALACPAAMLYLLLRVTGIPATEAQALRSRGDDYRDYQRTTSRFVPWPPKRGRRESAGSRLEPGAGSGT